MLEYLRRMCYRFLWVFVFRAAHAYHLNTLLEQLLQDSGLSVDWKDTILPLVKRISGQVLCYILYLRKCSKLD